MSLKFWIYGQKNLIEICLPYFFPFSLFISNMVYTSLVGHKNMGSINFDFENSNKL